MKSGSRVSVGRVFVRAKESRSETCGQVARAQAIIRSRRLLRVLEVDLFLSHFQEAVGSGHEVCKMARDASRSRSRSGDTGVHLSGGTHVAGSGGLLSYALEKCVLPHCCKGRVSMGRTKQQRLTRTNGNGNGRETQQAGHKTSALPMPRKRSDATLHPEPRPHGPQ